jgi:hypothetical protein
MEPYITHAISALAGGLVSSLVAPFIKWDIEKRKLRRQSRIDRIKFWRSEIDSKKDFREILDTATFNELRNRFTTEQLDKFQSRLLSKHDGKFEQWDRGKILEIHDVIDEIEKEWNII